MRNLTNTSARPSRRILALAMALCLLATMLPAASLAAKSGDFSYALCTYQDGGETKTGAAVTGYRGSGGAITIPDTMGGYSVTEIGTMAFYMLDDLTSVILPNSIRRIADSAFDNCYDLESITIPDEVSYIGDYAFYSCTSLASVAIPASVTFIGMDAFTHTPWFTDLDDEFVTVGDGVLIKYNGASGSVVIPNDVRDITNIFSGNADLTDITIPNGVTVIGNEAFRNCTGLTSVSIPGSVIEIGELAFAGCTELNSVTLARGLTKIGAGAFVLCAQLSEITVPNSVTHIGNDAFGDCSQLATITIPTSVTFIGRSAFVGTPWFLAQWEEGNPYVIVGDGVLIKYNEEGDTAVIPDGVKHIANAFTYEIELTDITIPNSVTSIGDAAFDYCVNLESIVIPDSVIEIGWGAFAYCTNLRSVKLPKDLSEISDSLFLLCRNLTSVTIPSGVTKIGENSFAGCNALTSINIPDGVTELVSFAFNGAGLVSVAIPSSVSEMGQGVFADCLNLERVTIASGDLFIGGWSFSECANLKEVYFGSLPPVLMEDMGVPDVFDADNPDLILYYPVAYAADWAPDGETTRDGYRIAPYTGALPSLADYGDANCDGKLTAADAALILRYIVKLDPLTGQGLANADANGDGKITAADAALILRFIVKLENKLGPK